MRLALDRTMVKRAVIGSDLAVLAAIVGVRWRCQWTAVPDPDLPGVAELPQWWWRVGWLGDWVLHPGPDAGTWAMNVRQWLENGELDLHRPPLYTILSGVATPLFGDMVFAGHMVNHLFSLLVCLTIYAFGRTTSGRGAAMGAALLAAMSPELLDDKTLFGVDTTLQFGILLLALATWWGANGRWWRLIPAGIAGGLAAGAHFISIAFVLPATILMLLRNESGGPWWRRLLDLGVVLSVSYGVWKWLMKDYPHTSLPRILFMYTDAVHSFNQEDIPGAHLGALETVSHLLVQLLSSPTEPFVRAMTAFSHLSIPGALLLPLCLLGLAGPGLRVWRSVRIGVERRPDGGISRSSSRGWELRSGLRLRIKRTLGWDWRPGLWMLVFLLPLVFAATAHAPERYTLYCVPLLFLTATRGIASIAAGADHLISRGSPGWPRGFLAFGACLILVAWAGTQHSDTLAVSRDEVVDVGLMERAVGARIKERFGEGGCAITFDSEVCFFAGGTACQAALCPEPGDTGLRSCLRTFMNQTPSCRGDLAYVIQPTQSLGPYLKPRVEMDDLVIQRFEIEDTLHQGTHETIIYRMERSVMEAIAAGGPVWLEPPATGNL